MKFEMVQIISLVARPEQDILCKDTQLPAAIEHKTRKGVAISFYIADMQPSFFNWRKGKNVRQL